MKRLSEVSPENIDPRLIEKGFVQQQHGTIFGILISWPTTAWVVDQVNALIDQQGPGGGANDVLKLLTGGAILTGGLALASQGTKFRGVAQDLAVAGGLTVTAVGAFDIIREVARITGILARTRRAPAITRPVKQIREVMIPPEEQFLPPIQ